MQFPAFKLSRVEELLRGQPKVALAFTRKPHVHADRERAGAAPTAVTRCERLSRCGLWGSEWGSAWGRMPQLGDQNALISLWSFQR